MTPMKVIVKSLIDFIRDDGLMLSGSISYFSVMALTPFCLFLITIFGHFLGNNPGFYEFFSSKISGLFPAATHETISVILNNSSYKGLGKFSLILYGLLSFQLFTSLQHAINVIFKVRRKRNLLFSVLISLAIITSIMAILIISFAVASVIPLFKFSHTMFPELQMGVITEYLIRFLVPFVLILLTVMIMYMLLPKTRVSLFSAFKGAVFAAIFFEIAKHVFTWYVGTVIHLGKIYGSLTAFVVFLLWVFYSSSIFLIGAEMVHNLDDANKY